MPARPAKTSAQKDPYASRGKELTSSVQRLRGWISTDPNRLPELVDALNALVAHRLEGHAYGAAGADAQDAVKQSADLLLASGPIGPYSSAVDAVRCGTALVQLAALQAAIGLVEAAGATLDSWDGVRAQVAEAGTRVQLAPAAGRHALAVAARVALAAADAARANACADAALAVPGVPGAETGFAGVDLERLASDTRWAAGLTEQSLGFLHSAKEAYEQVAGQRLADPGRLAPALAERLGEPLPGLYRDLADRLGAVGELDLALTNRRLLVERLRAVTERAESFRPALAAALTDLASDLLRAGRPEEAVDAATDAQAVAGQRGVPAPARLLAAAALARASMGSGRAVPAAPLRGLLAAEGEAAGPFARRVLSAALAETLRAEGLEEAAAVAHAQAVGEEGVVPVDAARGVVSRGDGTLSWAPLAEDGAYGAPLAGAGAAGAPAVPTWLEQERADARRQEEERAAQARREAEERSAEEALAREAEETAAALRAQASEQERRLEEARRRAAEEAEQAERKRRREERLREHQAEVDARERAQRDERRGEIDARLAELDAAEEPERERLLAERAALDEADTVPEPPVPPEVEPEPVPKVEPEPEVEPEAESEREAEPEPEPEREPEPAPPDDLAVAERALVAARTDGGRREVRAAAEAVVVLLRARHAQDPGRYTDRLRSALEDLSSARLRGGDIFGARAASREARALR